MCHVEVGDGKGAMMILRCGDDWDSMGFLFEENGFLSEQFPS